MAVHFTCKCRQSRCADCLLSPCVQLHASTLLLLHLPPLQGPFDHKEMVKELMALPHDEAEKRVRLAAADAFGGGDGDKAPGQVAERSADCASC